MADYKLKIEIDADDFTKKIQAALKKGGLGGLGSGGGTAGDKYSKMFSEKGEGGYTKSGADKLRIELLRIEGRRAQHAQDALDALNYLTEMTKEQKIRAENRAKIDLQKRFFGGMGISLVKIAGITTGIAGLSGLAKGLIDSSPMLQAMLKILQTGIMLMLRPIGDFIGFLLRPFVLLMLRYGIEFYRTHGKGFIQKGIETAERVGKVVAATGLFGPDEFVKVWSEAGKATVDDWNNFIANVQKSLEDFANDPAWENWQSAISKLFGTGGGMPGMLNVFADTGDVVDNNIDIMKEFNRALIYVYNTAKRIATKPDVREDQSTARTKERGNDAKYMDPDLYDEMVKNLGQSRTDEYLRQWGYGGPQSRHTGISGSSGAASARTKPRGGGTTIVYNTFKGDVVTPQITETVNKATQQKTTTVRLIE